MIDISLGPWLLPASITLSVWFWAFAQKFVTQDILVYTFNTVLATVASIGSWVLYYFTKGMFVPIPT